MYFLVLQVEPIVVGLYYVGRKMQRLVLFARQSGGFLIYRRYPFSLLSVSKYTFQLTHCRVSLTSSQKCLQSSKMVLPMVVIKILHPPIIDIN